jgi:polar amino acid transport system substrate-binding protein
MPRARFRSVLAILLLPLAGCGGSGPTAARQDTLDRIVATKVLRVGTNPGYAPFEMIDTDGNVIGFDPDVARYLASQMGNGVRVEFVKSDWDPIIANLNAGKFDVIMSGMTRTPERALRVAFTDPYFETGQALLVNRAKWKPSPKLNWRDFDKTGLVVATRLGTTGEIVARKLFQHATIKTLESESDAAMEVDAGRADVMVYDQPYVAIRTQESPERTFAILTPFTKEYLAMAVRPDDTRLRDWLDLTIFELKASGTYDSLYDAWFVKMPWRARVKQPHP